MRLFIGSMFLVGILGIVGYVFKELIVVVFYRVFFLFVVVLIIGRVLFIMFYFVWIVKVLLNFFFIRKFDLFKFYEFFKLFFFGLLLVIFGLIGGELVVLLFVNNCFFEGVLFREVWIRLYIVIFVGFIFIMVICFILNYLEEKGYKWEYRMVFYDIFLWILSFLEFVEGLGENRIVNVDNNLERVIF